MLPGDDTYSYAGAPYAAAYYGNLYAFATTTDGQAAYNVFDGDGWSEWELLDGSATYEGQPSAIANAGAHVVYKGTDGHAYNIDWQDGSWSDWTDLGANYAYDPYQYAYGDDLYLTYTGENGYVYYKVYEVAEDDGGY